MWNNVLGDKAKMWFCRSWKNWPAVSEHKTIQYKLITMMPLVFHLPLWCTEQSLCERGVYSVWTTLRSHGGPVIQCTGWTWWERKKHICQCVSVSSIECICVCVRTYLEGLVYGREIANTLTYCSATKLAYRWGSRTNAMKKKIINNHWSQYLVNWFAFCDSK